MGYLELSKQELEKSMAISQRDLRRLKVWDLTSIWQEVSPAKNSLIFLTYARYNQQQIRFYR